ncbi:MAG: RNA polymerase factor sigma-54 [Planctomycetota bacterium]|nr:RNA polymerase factor sigma-54 [Planctomycetota bacterium]
MKLGQQMKLAPRMIQSMEILQLPTLALEERIEQELESNITLETVEPGSDAPDREAPEDRAESDIAERELDIDTDNGAADFERLDSMETSYGEAFENEYSAADNRARLDGDFGRASRSRLAGERDGKMDAMANTAARGASYSEQLSEQWRFIDIEDPDIRAAGELLISFIDEDGYIRTPLEDIADRAPAGKSKPSVELLEKSLKVLQDSLDPVGVAARDLRECLLIQIETVERENPGSDVSVPKRLINEHLDDLLQNRLPRIAQKTGYSIDQINEGVRWMQRLNPAPGRALHDDTPPALIPDAIIEFDDEDDRYIAYLNDARIPNLRINEAYAKMVRDRDVEKPTKEFLRRNLTNAQWLIEAIAQRNHTLQRVLNVVVEAQRDFFDQGPQALKPLPMTQVADQLGVHVATVSRAVAGKHVQTPRGVMPLRKFFTGGTQTESGEDVSWDAIKAALKEIVDAEDKSSPLSDEALADAIKERGIDIARRTVAKYRAQLNIPSARMRKQF